MLNCNYISHPGQERFRKPYISSAFGYIQTVYTEDKAYHNASSRNFYTFFFSSLPPPLLFLLYNTYYICQIILKKLLNPLKPIITANPTASQKGTENKNPKTISPATIKSVIAPGSKISKPAFKIREKTTKIISSTGKLASVKKEKSINPANISMKPNNLIILPIITYNRSIINLTKPVKIS